jgi:hypothetical protein
MSSLKINGSSFWSYSNDHDPPHIDVRKDKGKMKVVLGTNENAPYIDRVKRMSDVDAKRAFKLVVEYHDEMAALWEKAHGKIDKP